MIGTKALRKTFKISLISAVMLVFSLNANAAILFAGGEDSDFTMAGAMTVNTTAGMFAAGYARSVVYFNGTSGGFPLTTYALSPTMTPNSVVWVHAKSYMTCGNTGLNNVVLELLSPDGVPRIVVRATATIGLYKVSTQNAASTYADLVTMPSACFCGLHSLDLYVNYAAAGQTTLYCDGAAVADYSGNVTTNAATQINQLKLGTPGGCCGGASQGWSEVIVATTNTRNMRLVTLTPTANGNTTAFDTGGVTNINEVTLNDSTVNASATANQVQQYTVNALPAGLWSIVDLWLNMRAQADTTGPQHIQGVVRTSATDYTSANLSPPQGSFGFISTNWSVNPNTGLAWTSAELGAAGFNIGFKSTN